MRISLCLALSDQIALIAPTAILPDMVKTFRIQNWHFSCVEPRLEQAHLHNHIRQQHILIINLPQLDDVLMKWLEATFSPALADASSMPLQGMADRVLMVCPSCQLEERRRLATLGFGELLLAPHTEQELLWRIKRLATRFQTNACADHRSDRFQWHLDQSSGLLTVSKSEQPIYLTPSERSVLMTLVNSQGRVVSRHGLARVMGASRANGGGSLNTIVLRLRKKLSSAGLDEMQLITVPKRGYRVAL